MVRFRCYMYFDGKAIWTTDKWGMDMKTEETGRTPRFLVWVTGINMSFTKMGKTKNETSLSKKISWVLSIFYLNTFKYPYGGITIGCVSAVQRKKTSYKLKIFIIIFFFFFLQSKSLGMRCVCLCVCARLSGNSPYLNLIH